MMARAHLEFNPVEQSAVDLPVDVITQTRPRLWSDLCFRVDHRLKKLAETIGRRLENLEAAGSQLNEIVVEMRTKRLLGQPDSSGQTRHARAGW